MRPSLNEIWGLLVDGWKMWLIGDYTNKSSKLKTSDANDAKKYPTIIVYNYQSSMTVTIAGININLSI